MYSLIMDLKPMPQFRALMSKYPIQLFLLCVGILCLSLLAIQPFTLNQMPETADGILHLYRVVATDYSLKVDNALWMRYSTGIVYGYGAPLFNYFPPLSYYVGSWLHTWGLSFIQSWLMMMALYTVISAVGMFLLGRIWTQSNVGGWVTAMAYIYAPYFLFDSIARGTSSELGALAILPFAFYGFTRLAFYGRRSDFLVAVIAFALFIPMHTIITLHGTLLLGVYCLFLWLTSDDKRRTFLRLLLAGGLALTITTFFWMPAMLETDAVKINLIAENLNQIDVTRHLRPLTDILAFPHTADPTQMAQPIPITLSLVQLILSAFGLVIAWNDRNALFRNLLLTLWGFLLVFIFMNTPLSAWLWENFPLIGYTQFPWRILGLASLILALMTGISVWLSWTIIPVGWIKASVFSVLTLMIVTYGIPWTYSLYLDDIELNDIRDVQDFERDTGQLTVSSYSEYLPVSTDESQLDPNRLIERFEQSDIIPRLLENDDLKIVSEEWTSTSATLKLNSLEAQTLIFDWLYVDGWTAQIDNQSLEVYPNLPEGLVAVDVPQGEFELQISLQPTSIQSRSVLISLIGVLGVIGVSIAWRYFSGFSNLHNLDFDPEITIFAVVIAIGIGVFLFKAIVLDSINTQFKSTRFGDLSAENSEIMPLANFGNQIDLIDAELPRGEISSRFMEIKLYWKLHDKSIDTDYSSIVRMRDPQGIVIAESSSFQPGGLATSNWMSDTYVIDTIEFEISQFTPPLISDFKYTLDVSLFDAITLENIDVINAQGNPESTNYILTEIELLNYDGGRDLRNDRMQPKNLWDLGVEDVGLYIGVDKFEFPESAMVGDELIFNWTWQRTFSTTSFDDLYAKLIWSDPSNDIKIVSQSVPLVFGYPVDFWTAGEVITGQHRLIIPAYIPAGEYQIGIQLLDEKDGILGIPFYLDQEMTINVPERNREQPKFDLKSIVRWDSGLQLIGYTLDEIGEVILGWNIDELQDKSLRLFVHVLDESDVIIDQSDGIPVDWTRPTTSWITTEYVTTTHQFDLPEGDYHIRVGWYDSYTGDRISVENSDAIILDELLKIE
jgi:hypothetical protein